MQLLGLSCIWVAESRGLDVWVVVEGEVAHKNVVVDVVVVVVVEDDVDDAEEEHAGTFHDVLRIQEGNQRQLHCRDGHGSDCCEQEEVPKQELLERDDGS